MIQYICIQQERRDLDQSMSVRPDVILRMDHAQQRVYPKTHKHINGLVQVVGVPVR